MYKLFVAFRYLRRNWLNLVGVGAVAIGVVVLICVLSVMKGFDEEFRSRIRATLSDLIVESPSDGAFGGYEEMMGRIEKLPHVQAVAPEFEGLALVQIPMGGRKISRYAEFHGIDLPCENKATDFADYWQAWRGREARDGISQALAHGERLDKAPKEEVEALLSGMRRADFDLLDSETRKEIESWAGRNKFDLSAAFRAAEKAIPMWGPAEDPKVSPAIAGAEMLILGQDQSGRPVGVEPGEQVMLIAATDVNYEERAFRRCRIVGEFRSGLYDYDRGNIYLPLADVQQLMQQPGKVSSISIRLDSFDNAPEVRSTLLGILTPDEIAAGIEIVRPHLRQNDPAVLRDLDKQLRDLRENLPKWFAEGNSMAVMDTVSLESALSDAATRAIASPGGPAQDKERLLGFQKKVLDREKNGLGNRFRVNTWEDKRRNFLRAVWLERRIMGFILFFVILIAGVLILSILHTTVISKTRDIGILKSIGGSVRGIMSIFLLNGLLMGILGSALGATGAMLITQNINAIEGFLHRLFGFSLFPADIYYLERIPVDKHPWPSVLVTCLLAIAVSLAASAYPAWKAARMDPVEALRYE